MALVFDALLVSLKVAASATLLVVPFAFLLAWVLARRTFRGKSLVETIVLMPLVLPPTAVGYLLVLALRRDGPLGRQALGFDLDLLLTWKGAVLSAACMSRPLVVRTARVAFEEVPTRLEWMGRSLGLSPQRVFAMITVPLAARGLCAAIVLGFGRALGEFGATVIVAGNIPGETQTLSLAIFDGYQLGHDRQVLTAIGIVALIAFALSFLVERLLRGRARGSER